jgi:prepilin-type N-terminal cleavage/methylation domain-containing protein/prepilin-type processing-associated H-X9-DG protein
MKPFRFQHNSASPSHCRGQKAFTLIELLVVLAVLAVLVSLKLPGLARAQDQSRQAECASNLRQFTLALITYGADNNDLLPTNPSGSWAFMLARPTSDMLNQYGAQRTQMYCPANTDQNADGLWNFAPQYRVIGYAMTLPGTGSVIAADQNIKLTPSQAVIGSVFLPAPAAAKRVLTADVIISMAGQTTTAQKLNYQYKGIQGGFSQPHRSSHFDVNGRYPTGGNTGMLDGHVEWHSFANVTCHTQGGSPGFWW